MTTRGRRGDARERGFSPAGFFALRTPLLPFSELLEWADGVEAPSTVPGSGLLGGALARDRAKLRERLRAKLDATHVREALFVAAAGLHDALDAWAGAPESAAGLKAERPAVRYFARMAARPTPFGLFAGCSLGSLGDTTRLALGPLEAYRRHTRLDMAYVTALVDDLVRRPELRRSLTYRPNSSLYYLGGQIRYAEARLMAGALSYHLVAITLSGYLAAALKRAAGGATLSAIAEAVCAERADVVMTDAESFVDELIDSQVIVPELLPVVTGPEPLTELRAQLQRRPSMIEVSATLDRVAAAVGDLDRNGLSNGASRYRAVADQLGTIGTKVDLPRLFQVDMLKPTQVAQLGPDVIGAVTALVTLLHRIGPTPQSDLSRFRDAFVARYEAREVPLVEVLDEETGIGFGPKTGPSGDASPLLAGLPFPGPADEHVRLGRVERFLWRKLEWALRTGLKEIVLDEDDIAELENEDPVPLPDSFSAVVTLVASSPGALAGGDFRIHAQGCMGPSGAAFIGRFCHADPQLAEHVRAYLRDEEAHRPAAAFAEIVHSPEGRLGNVIARPLLREYEIPFLGRSGAPEERQIPISDLTVSVVDGRVVLRSVALGREVIPRLTNAHNFEKRALTTYRFLCTLVSQGTLPVLGFSWGSVESSFFPRVSIGRFILARARWQIPSPLRGALGAGDRDAAWGEGQRLRRELGLPRFVSFSEGDHLLPIDFDNVLSVESFVQLARNRESVTLEELLPGPGELCVSGPEGLFAHELIVPFTRARAPADQEPASRTGMARGSVEAPPRVVRSFPPCSEWLYLKVYCGPATADRVLRELLAARLESIRRVADRWFFVRYADPEWHVRLRFRGASDRLMGELLPEISTAIGPLLRDGRAWRVQVNTYEREIERYGGPAGILLSESIFQEDSLAVLRIVELLDGDEGLRARWQLGLRGMDLLLRDLGLDLPARLEVAARLRAAFADEHRVGPEFEHELGVKFRRERASLEALFDPAQEASHPYASGIAILRDRSVALAPVMRRLREADARGLLTSSLTNLAFGLLHMHANRILRSSARAQELVLYDFLRRLYESEAARARRAGPRAASGART